MVATVADGVESPERFSSMDRFRSEHSKLLNRHRDLGPDPVLLDEVVTFLRQGEATGAILDDEEDRWAAQSLLDYWVTVLYRADSKRTYRASLANLDESLLPWIDERLCPYLGLNAFDESDKGKFYGRHAVLDLLLDQLKKRPLLAVEGPSGSGKSSVVRAGLIPALRIGKIPGSESWKIFPTMVPGSEPMLNLAIALHDPTLDGEGPREEAAAKLALALKKDPHQLAQRLDQPGGPPAVIVIDQFEEVFTLCTDLKERKPFTDALVDLCGRPELRHRVVLTMRDDFRGNVVRIPPLYELYDQGKVTSTALNETELRQAIEEPAAKVGLLFEKGVVDGLVEDCLGEPAALPLLQYTLLKLWEQRWYNKVTMEAYKRLGGGRKALARGADDFYENDLATQEEKNEARKILLRMVRPGEGLEVTNRRIPKKSLFPEGENKPAIQRVLDKLVNARLVKVTKGLREVDDQVEVAHEALVRNWPRLVDWLTDQRSAIVARQRLEAKAAEWVRLGRDQDGLLVGIELDEARRWLESGDAKLLGYSQDLPDLVDASRRALSRWQWFVFGMSNAVLGLIFALLTWFAYIQFQQSQVAFARNLAAQAELIRNQQPDKLQTAVLLSVEALDRLDRLPQRESRGARQTLLNVLSLMPRKVSEFKEEGIVAFAISPKVVGNEPSPRFATADWNRVIRVYTSEKLILKTGSDSFVNTLTFGPDGRRLIAISPLPPEPDNNANRPFYSGASGYLTSPILSAQTAQGPVSVQRSPVDAGASNTIQIFDLDNLDQVGQPRTVSPESPVVAAMLSHDNAFLYTADRKHTVRAISLVDSSLVTIIHEQPENSRAIGVVTFSPDGLQMAYPVLDNIVELLLLNDDHAIPFDLTKPNKFSASILTYSSDGHALANQNPPSQASTSIQVVDPTNPQELKYLVNGSLLDRTQQVVAVSPDGKLAATVSEPPTQALNVAGSGMTFSNYPPGGTSVQVWTTPQVQIRSPGASRGLLAGAGSDGLVRVYDLETSREVSRVVHNGPVVAAGFMLMPGKPAPLTTLVTVGRNVPAGPDSKDESGDVVRLSIPNVGDTIESRTFPGTLVTAAFSPKGGLLATATPDKLDPNLSVPQATFSASTGRPASKGRVRLASLVRAIAPAVAYSARTTVPPRLSDHVRLFRTDNGDQVAFQDDQRPVNALGFGPDGKTLLAVCPASNYYPLPTVLYNQGFSQGPLPAAAPSMTSDANARRDHSIKLYKTNGLQAIEPISLVAPIGAAAVGPEGDRVATATWGGVTHVYNLGATEPDERAVAIPKIPPHDGPMNVELSADGRFFATIDWDNTVVIRRLPDGRECGRVRHANLVFWMSFSPDGSFLATISNLKIKENGGTLTIVRSDGGQVVPIKMEEGSFTSFVQFSPDGAIVSTVNGRGGVRVFRTQGGEEIKIDSKVIPGTGFPPTFSPDGRYLTKSTNNTPTNPGSIQIWDVSNSTQLGELPAPTAYIYSQKFSPGGKFLAISRYDGYVDVWTVTRIPVRIASVRRNSIATDVIFTRDEQFLLSLSFDALIRTKLDPLAKPAMDNSLGAKPTTGSSDKPETETGQSDKEDLKKLKGGPWSTQSLSQDQSGAYLTLINRDQVKWLPVDVLGDLPLLKSGSKTVLLPNHEGLSTSTFSKDGRILAEATLKSTTQVFRKPDWKKPQTLDSVEPISALAFAKNGILAAASLNGSVKVYQENPGQNGLMRLLISLRHGGPVTALAFDLDGNRLATTGADNVVKVWEVGAIVNSPANVNPGSGDPGLPPLLLELDHKAPVSLAHQARVTAMTFQDKGPYLATATVDNVIRVWDLDADNVADKELVRISSQAVAVALAFGPKNGQLSAISEDNVQRILPWSTAVLRTEAESRSTRNLSKVEWETYWDKLDKMPYELTFDTLREGPGVGTGMVSANPWTKIVLLIVALVIWGFYCLLLVNWNQFSKPLREGGYFYLLPLALIVPALWGICSSPVVRIGGFSLPSVGEKYLIMVIAFLIALLCRSVQKRVLSEFEGGGVNSFEKALHSWWVSIMNPPTAR